MLTELNIKNYALIDSLQIKFDKGLNALTGETGAGKSIIIDAMGLLLGEKASVSVIRKESQRCEITGIFAVAKNKIVQKFLKELSLQNEEDCDTLFLRREADVQGKSKSYINDKPVNLSTLAQLGDLLVDIHGQHEHQYLLKSNQQKDLLDRYGENDSLREEIAQIYDEWKKIEERIQTSQISEQEKNQKIDLYQFQLNELDSAKLMQGEEEEIEKMLPQLKNAERLREWAGELYAQLYDTDGSASERIQKSRRIVESILNCGVDLGDCPSLLEESSVRISEALNRIETFKDKLVSDPAKLDELISRQDLISKLKKKYGKTILEILEYREKIHETLQQLQNHSETVQELEKQRDKTYITLIKQCKKLSQSRNKNGEKLSAKVQKELKELGFQKPQFSVQLSILKDENGKEIVSSTGLEKVEFLFSANPGEDLKPLRAVASGGELSRIMLALKNVLAQSDTIPALIFDEIDSGVGGSMGNVIGEKLKNLSATHQILVITHLPQIAAYADQHFLVRKNVANKRTITNIECLYKQDRIKEVARMLGGVSGNGQKEPTLAALNHAAELLQHAH